MAVGLKCKERKKKLIDFGKFLNPDISKPVHYLIFRTVCSYPDEQFLVDSSYFYPYIPILSVERIRYIFVFCIEFFFF